MQNTVTTFRLIVDESQPPIKCFSCGERATWAFAMPTQSGLYEMQPFCHEHLLKLVEASERSRRRLARIQAKLDAHKG